MTDKPKFGSFEDNIENMEREIRVAKGITKLLEERENQAVLTYNECVSYLSSQRNVPDELWDAEEAKAGAVDYLATLNKYPETVEELQDNYMAHLVASLDL